MKKNCYVYTKFINLVYNLFVFIAMLLLQVLFEYGYQISAVRPQIQNLRDVITVEWETMTVTTVKMLQYPVIKVSRLLKCRCVLVRTMIMYSE